MSEVRRPGGANEGLTADTTVKPITCHASDLLCSCIATSLDALHSLFTVSVMQNAAERVQTGERKFIFLL